jgi:hypothetical protein
MPVEIHEFEVSPAPAAAPPAASPPTATAASPAAPGLQTLAEARRLAAAARELQLRTFAH